MNAVLELLPVYIPICCIETQARIDKRRFRNTTCSIHSKLDYSFTICSKLSELTDSGYFGVQLIYILETAVFVWKRFYILTAKCVILLYYFGFIQFFPICIGEHFRQKMIKNLFNS